MTLRKKKTKEKKGLFFFFSFSGKPRDGESCAALQEKQDNFYLEVFFSLSLLYQDVPYEKKASEAA